MTSAASQSPVEPRLFSLIERYAVAIKNGEVDLGSPLRRDSPVVQFCIEFFHQFFEHELDLEIKGFNPQSKESAVRRRLELEQERDTAPTRQLILAFQKLCDSWPDILGFSYGGSRLEFRRFHAVYVPRLLHRIEVWAEAKKYSTIVEAVQSAARVYAPVAKRL
jgi:hypothetical protein